eukprot:9637424-Lingulodinium_polyedra.AAC.1
MHGSGIATKWRGEPGPFSSAAGAAATPPPALSDATYADDIALMVETDDPEKLCEAAGDAVAIAATALRQRGFTLNLNRGKTGAVL